jgi:hypothetical protein
MVIGVKHRDDNFQNLLSLSNVTEGGTALTEAEKAKSVRVQRDPERRPKLEVLPYPSIQIGIGRSLSQKWARSAMS